MAILRVQCSHCKGIQIIHTVARVVAAAAGAGGAANDDAPGARTDGADAEIGQHRVYHVMPCLRCDKLIKVTIADRIVAGPFPA